MSDSFLYKVSVIVPIYNARNTIEKCIRSLFEQTLDCIEYIIIDDNSNDGSGDVIRLIASEYPSRLIHIKIIRHEHNEGVGKSRQEGMDIARGKYVIHCDSDDWVNSDAYEILYNEAQNRDAEICICDYIEETSDGSIIKHQAPAVDKKLLFNSIIIGEFHTSFWNKLISRRFWNSSECRIASELSLWEDMSVVLPLLIYSRKIAYINAPMYHYRVGNAASITGSFSKDKVISAISAVESIKSIMTKWNLYSTYKNEIDHLMLRASHHLIAFKWCFNPKLWRDVNDVSLFQLLKFRIPFRNKFYYALALLRLDFVMKAVLSMRS